MRARSVAVGGAGDSGGNYDLGDVLGRESGALREKVSGK